MNKRAFGIVAVAALAVAALAAPVAAAPWDVSGAYVAVVMEDGNPTPYAEDLVLVQNGTQINGTSIDFNGGCSFFNITGGSVVGTAIVFNATQAGCGGVETEFSGTIAADGSMSGTWEDTAVWSRTGTWATTSGSATGPIQRCNYADPNAGGETGNLITISVNALRGHRIDDAVPAGAKKVTICHYNGHDAADARADEVVAFIL